MSKSEIFRKFRIYLLFCLSAMGAERAFAQGFGRGGFEPEQMIEREDRNGNGRLEPDEMNSFLRGMLERANVDVSKGVGKDDLRKAFDEMRRMREQGGGFGFGFGPPGGFGGGPPGGFGGGPPGSDRGDSSRSDRDRGDRGSWRDRRDRGDRGDRDRDERREEESRSSEQKSTTVSATRTIKLPEKSRVTVDLPKAFEEGDIDRDGQVSFFEWRQWKRGALDEFAAYDENGDGFLTPRELLNGPRTRPASTAVASVSSGSSSPSNSAGRSDRMLASVSRQSSSASSTSGDSGNLAKIAADRFQLLDKNRDGSISIEEWGRSKIIRAQFEKAGIDLSGSMSKDDFVSHYVRVNVSGT